MNRAPSAALPAILAVTLLAWAGAVLRGGFALDDREVLERNPVIAGTLPWREVFLRDYWEHHPAGAAGHYRPLATASLRIDHALYGGTDAATPYHATNLLLHLAVVGIAGLLLARLARDGLGAGASLGLLVFAVHPALADSVAWISGRTSMLSALGGLAGLVLVARACERGSTGRILVGAAAATLLGGLGKEDGTIFGVAAVLWARSRSRGAGLASAAGVLAGTAALLGLRRLALGEWLPSMTQAPLAASPLLERAAVGGRALTEGLHAVVMPVRVPPSLELETLERLPTAAAVLAWVALATALLGGTLLLRSGSGSRRLIGASLSLASLACLPWTQLVPIGELFAPRFLYLPLLFAAPAIDAVLEHLLRVPAARRIGAVALVLTAVPLCWRAAGVYADRASYWEARLLHEARSPRAWNALGNARVESGDEEGARAAWERSIELDPTYSRAWNNLGGAMVRAGDLEEAEPFLRRAVAAGPRNPIAWANLAGLLWKEGRFAEACEAYERAVDLSPSAARLWRLLARARWDAGDATGARAAITRALALDPGDASTRRLAARIREHD